MLARRQTKRINLINQLKLKYFIIRTNENRTLVNQLNAYIKKDIGLYTEAEQTTHFSSFL